MARKELTVEPRQITGKKVAQLRRAGKLPANVYGKGLESVSLEIDTDQLLSTIKTMTANEVLDLKIAGINEEMFRPTISDGWYPKSRSAAGLIVSMAPWRSITTPGSKK